MSSNLVNPFSTLAIELQFLLITVPHLTIVWVMWLVMQEEEAERRKKQV